MPILIKGRGVRRLQRKKQNFIQGAFILMLASLLVKVIGAFFQIPLLNMIGGKDSPAFGMFSAAYRVYTAMLMISTVGVPAALAKMVAEATARGREHEVRRTSVCGKHFHSARCGLLGRAVPRRGHVCILDQERGFPAGGYGHRTECADGCCSGGVPRLLSGPLEHGADGGFAGDRVTRQAVYRSWTGVLCSSA